MTLRNRNRMRAVRGLRRVLRAVHPDRLRLSPLTVMEVIGSADPHEIDIIEIKDQETGEVIKHISFRGVPIFLSIKLSHNMQNLAML